MRDGLESTKGYVGGSGRVSSSRSALLRTQRPNRGRPSSAALITYAADPRIRLRRHEHRHVGYAGGFGNRQRQVVAAIPL